MSQTATDATKVSVSICPCGDGAPPNALLFRLDDYFPGKLTLYSVVRTIAAPTGKVNNRFIVASDSSCSFPTYHLQRTIPVSFANNGKDHRRVVSRYEHQFLWL